MTKPLLCLRADHVTRPRTIAVTGGSYSSTLINERGTLLWVKIVRRGKMRGAGRQPKSIYIYSLGGNEQVLSREVSSFFINPKPPILKPSPITLNLLFRASGGCYGNRIGGAYTAHREAGAPGSVAGGDNIGGNEK